MASMEVPCRVGARLRAVVQRATGRLLVLPEESTDRSPAPGKWSPREVLGHLIDSASNNHQRFVRAQMQEDMVFAGYPQDDWVAAQRYGTAPWMDLVTLWKTFNLHLARVMEVAPADARLRERSRHNLHEIAWATVASNDVVTLEFFMNDYVDHLEHHLAQIFGREDPS